MNTLQFANGGRPVANDDFLTLQNLHQVLSLPALLSGLGPCVVSGCRVYQTGSVWNVAPGVVWDGVNLLDFQGRSNVSLPAMFVPGDVVVVDERAYQDGTTKTTIKAQGMDLVAVVAGAPNLVIDTSGALTFWQRVQEQTIELGTVEYVTDLTGYDETGRGLGPKRGWALCNGQNGTKDLRGQFVAAYDSNKRDYDTVGKTGGAEAVRLTTAQLPSHTHGSNNLIVDSRGNGEAEFRAAYTASTGARGKGLNIQAAGSDQEHENRPPYTVLAARQRVGF